METEELLKKAKARIEVKKTKLTIPELQLLALCEIMDTLDGVHSILNNVWMEMQGK